jgi:hypothetical protein
VSSSALKEHLPGCARGIEHKYTKTMLINQVFQSVTFSSIFFNERSRGMKMLGFGRCKSSSGAFTTHFCKIILNVRHIYVETP